MRLNIPANVQYLVLIFLLDFIQLFQTTSQFMEIVLKANSTLYHTGSLYQLYVVHKFNKHTLCQVHYRKC